MKQLLLSLAFMVAPVMAGGGLSLWQKWFKMTYNVILNYGQMGANEPNILAHWTNILCRSSALGAFNVASRV